MSSAHAVALETIERYEGMVLRDARDKVAFVAAMLKPPAPSRTLKAAAAPLLKLLRSSQRNLLLPTELVHPPTETPGRQHYRASFSCGVRALDSYLREGALRDQRRHAAVVLGLTACRRTGADSWLLHVGSLLRRIARSAGGTIPQAAQVPRRARRDSGQAYIRQRKSRAADRRAPPAGCYGGGPPRGGGPGRATRPPRAPRRGGGRRGGAAPDGGATSWSSTPCLGLAREAAT